MSFPLYSHLGSTCTATVCAGRCGAPYRPATQSAPARAKAPLKAGRR